MDFWKKIGRHGGDLVLFLACFACAEYMTYGEFQGFWLYLPAVILPFLIFSLFFDIQKTKECFLVLFTLLFLQLTIDYQYPIKTIYHDYGIIALGLFTSLFLGRFLLKFLMKQTQQRTPERFYGGKDDQKNWQDGVLWHYYLAFCCAYMRLEYLEFEHQEFFYPSLTLFLIILIAAWIPRYSRATVFGFVLLYCVLLNTEPTPDYTGKEDQPNLLFIVVDTLRRDGLSCYDSPYPTPAIDSLAKEGVLFENAYSTAPWTLPSMFSMFTGLYPTALGFDSNTTFMNKNAFPLGSDAEPLALVLRRNNYRTIGMVCNPVLHKKTQINIGFDQYANWYFPIFPLFRKIQYIYNPDAKPHAGQVLTDEAYRRIKRGKGSYFLWLHYYAPHLPYSNSNNFPDVTQYKKGYGNLHPASVPSVDRLGLMGGYLRLNPKARRFLHWYYDQEIARVDGFLKSFLEKLKKDGYLDNTLVVFTSDHGEEFWEHGQHSHGHTVYNELIRIPLILYYPEKLKPQKIAKNVSHIQLYKTILNLLDIKKLPSKLDWRVQDLFAEPLKYIFSEALVYFEERKALIDQKGWKWIKFDGGKEEFYNLKEDPEEQKPISRKPDPKWVDYFDLWKKQNNIFRDTFKQGAARIELSEKEKQKLKALGYTK